MNKFVYFHLDGDEVVYIGRGSTDRATSLRNRTDEHKELILKHLNIGDYSFIEYQDSGMTQEEAIWLEKELIKEYQPRFNKYFKDNYIRPKIKPKSRVIPEGTIQDIVEPERLVPRVPNGIKGLKSKVPY